MSIQLSIPKSRTLVLFTLCAQPAVKNVDRHFLCFHLYADDNQVYKACRIEDLPTLVSSTSDCISNVKNMDV